MMFCEKTGYSCTIYDNNAGVYPNSLFCIYCREYILEEIFKKIAVNLFPSSYL